MTAGIPRREFDQLDQRLQSILEARVNRLGYLGEFFKLAGHQPAVLASFMEMTESLKKALPDRLTEVGALTVAKLMENDYERHQHERLSAKLGFSHEWIATVLRLQPDADDNCLTAQERAVQRLVIALIMNHGKGVGDLLDSAIGVIGAEQVIAVLFLTGRYVTHALVVNALALAPPVPSIFPTETA
jgi:alkylhydroperoxidase family enzyme